MSNSAIIITLIYRKGVLTMMNFEELLAKLGDAYEGVTVYSVEDREMTTHETAIVYYFDENEKILNKSLQKSVDKYLKKSDFE